MKKQIFLGLLGLALLGGAATAQTPFDKTGGMTEFGERLSHVYFGSGAATLSAADKAQLEAFSKELKGEKAVIQGFADNVGSKEKNLSLAAARAENVKNYLLELGVQPAQIEIAPAQILAKSATENHRKVSLKYTKFSNNGLGNLPNATGQIDNSENNPLASLSAFYAHCGRESQQTEQIDPSRGSLVKGKKGAIIYIPAGSLVDANGKPAQGPVSLTIQEAHSFGDMILLNWTTTAQGRILETGGMLRLEARDQNGQILQLAPDQQAQISLPNANAQAQNMQIFNGKIDSATNNIDWHATNQLVNNTGNNNLRNLGFYDPFNTASEGTFGDSTFIKIRELAQSCEIFTTAYAAYAAAPKGKAPKAPVAPQLASLPDAPTAPKKNNIKSQNPKNTNESDSDYGSRIQKIYAAQQQTYQKAKEKYDKISQANRQKELAYQKELRAYTLDSTKFHRQTNRRQAYEASLRHRLGLVAKWVKSNSLDDIQSAVFYASNSIKNMSAERLRNQKEYLLTQYAFFASQHPTIQTLQQQQKRNIQALFISAQDSANLQIIHIETHMISSRLLSNISNAKGLKRNRKMLSNAKQAKMLAQAQNLLNKTNWSEKDFHEADQLFVKLKQTPLLAQVKREMHSLAKLFEKEKNTLQNTENQFNTARREYTLLNETRIQLGLMTAAEIAQSYRNSMSISSLGTINCDRFLDDNSPKGCIDILVDKSIINNTNAQFFVVFEDIQSVMNAAADKNMFKADKIPLDRQVKIIGLCLDGKQAYIASAKGSVRDFIKNKYKPDFQPKTLEEAKNILKNT